MVDNDFLEPERPRAFVTVAETGSFTRAAERLHLTQPTISTQVRRLEESIGRALFERNAQFARLTSDGETMLGYARELLEVIGRAHRQFAQPPLEGSVRFGMVEDFGTTALPSILGRLRQDHPHFELTVETGLGSDLVRRLETDSLDLILTKRVSGRYDSPALCRQNLVWVGRSGLF
jgi:DNA-binding transcriptional LysR family regulator